MWTDRQEKGNCCKLTYSNRQPDQTTTKEFEGVGTFFFLSPLRVEADGAGDWGCHQPSHIYLATSSLPAIFLLASSLAFLGILGT